MVYVISEKKLNDLIKGNYNTLIGTVNGCSDVINLQLGYDLPEPEDCTKTIIGDKTLLINGLNK